MISRFFIDRPIFASVLSILITLAGAVSLLAMPIALYPPISPPVVQVSCTFPGASAQVVAESVATPIEEQVNGVEDMMYMSSQCTNDGAYNLTVTFKHGIDLNVAQVLVQNRVSLAIPRLPDVLKQTGVVTRKKSPDILMAIAINSPDSSRDQLYLSNYALMHLKDELSRVPGVSDVNMMGQRDYSMRIWLDPDQLAARSMTPGDVIAAIRSQNLQVASGQIGQPPMDTGQKTQITLSTKGRLVEVDQFENIIVRATPEGRLVRIKDIARVELGAKNEDISGRVNGNPTISLAIFQLPDANALDVAVDVKNKMNELAADFPPGVKYEIRYDTTPFITESIAEVFKTLQEAILLVAIVVLLFLQSWRSSIIPLVAVPVAIVGTFAVLIAMGFTLNNLTLFGLVLAIGIVVDDAIVVVEAVEHHIEHGLSPHAATVKAMEEVSGPVIAIGLVLSAVFIPCAFISGIVGQFFRQFALTIATSTLISAFNSLTLSPALAALLLRPKDATKDEALPRPAYALIGGWLGWEHLTHLLSSRLPRRLLADPTAARWLAPVLAAVIGIFAGWLLARALNWVLGGVFRLFNAAFRRGTGGYTRIVGWMLRVSFLVIVGYGGLLYLTYWGLKHTPAGFIPSQDMGYLLVNVQLPDSASAARTGDVMNKLEKIAHEIPGVKHTQTTAGMSLLLSANGSNFGSMFVILDSFAKRIDPRMSSDSVAKQLRERYEREVPEAIMTVLGPPPIRGVGRAGGFKLMVEDRGDLGSQTLQGQTENLVDQAKAMKVESGTESPLTALKAIFQPSKAPKKEAQKPAFVGLTSVFRANVPQLYADVNRRECMAKEVQLKDLFDTLRVYLGSLYVNDFNQFGRTWQVVVQADARFRNRIDDAKRLKVRNAAGTMVPVAALADIREVTGPLMLTRYNMYPAAPLNGSSAPGVSSGTGIAMMEELAKAELLPSMTTEWTELAYLEIQAGNTAMIVFGFAVVMVFLVLAAQYESWTMPLAVILVVPMCLLGSIVGVQYTGSDINIFTQIGFVVLVGLACKNAILIVEFSKVLRDRGESPREATLEACRLRLRPIVMTSLAFILGVVPLITSHGAGAEMRRTLGTTVFSGMIGVTVFGIFLTPVFFYVIDRVSGLRLFHFKWVERTSRVLLRIVSLRFLGDLVRRTPRLVKTLPGTAGNGEAGQGSMSSRRGSDDPRPAEPASPNGPILAPVQSVTVSNGSSSPIRDEAATSNGHGNGHSSHGHPATPSPAANGQVPPASRPDGPLTPR